MIFEEDKTFQAGPIFYGCLLTLAINLVLTILLAIATEFGWTGIVKPYHNNLYLFIGYLAVIIGSVMAGKECPHHGWLTGLMVGLLSSLVLLMITAFIGQPVLWGIFLIKMLIAIFIGVFGGIIGVNLAGNKI